MLSLRKPYLLYLGDSLSRADCKTAFGLRDWCPADVVGEWSRPQCTVSLGIERLDPRTAAARGAGSLVIGVAPTGGQLPASWQDDLVAALAAGLDVVSGLHTRLAELPRLAEAAGRGTARLVDVRHPTRRFAVATGRRRNGRRLLTVGTDCALGKKYTALAISRELQARGTAADFRATGQTGILISGGGVAVDAVVADFIAGAAESLSPDNDPAHWDVIEGQGSLLHPAYAAVTLGLLHGSQPDAIVLCHDPGRTHIDEYPDYPIPPLAQVVDMYLRAGRLTNAGIRCIGLSINSSGLDEAAWRDYAQAQRAALGVPVCDPMRGGVGALVDALLAP